MRKSLLLACSLWLAVLPSQADVRYTTKTKTPGSPMEMVTTTWVKGKRQRTETLTDMGSMKTKSVQLIMCDTHQMAQLDPDLKIYTVTSMDSKGGNAGGGPSGTGTVVNTYTVKDLGTETVAKLKAHHWMVTTQSKGSGCVGTFDTTTKVEIWTAAVQVLNCPEQAVAAYNQPNCRVTFEEKGDVKSMRAAYDGMAVKMINYQGDQKISEQEFVDYSTAALEDGLFALPKDYKQVTAAEFQAQQQQKMMQQFQVPKP